jgi:hypothetical protein
MIKAGLYNKSYECIGCGALHDGTVLIEKDIEHLDVDPLSITCFLCEMHNDVGLILIEKEKKDKKEDIEIDWEYYFEGALDFQPKKDLEDKDKENDKQNI